MPVYKTLKNKNSKDVLIWTDDVDELSLQQLANVAKLPFVFRHIAAMPDVHAGMGATIGSVIPTQGAVIPAAVGVDIGCGMLAVKTNMKRNDATEKELNLAMKAILKRTPVGMAQHKPENTPHDACKPFERPIKDILKREPTILDAMKKMTWQREMGTLGSGNHFIELSADKNNDLWIMLHSGSRGPGNVMANFFIKKARKQMEEKNIKLPDSALAYFEEGTADFENYMTCVSWAQDYAMANRQTMLSNVILSLNEVWKGMELTSDVINCHHNYVERENHFGEDVWVTRKGAIRAEKGEMGIIPGSMGAASYIVKGLGNPESFYSSSHGAGRKMSRKQALNKFSVADLERETKGVICRKDKGVLDEIPSAYKNIDKVMSEQTDLTEAVFTLKQILCVKG